jgi:Mitochondrial carrier protein
MSQPLLASIGPRDRSIRLPRRSFLSIARDIHAEEGVRGFLRGLGPTFLRAFPSNASALFVYEGILNGLGAEKVIQLSALCAMYLLLNSHPDSALTKFRRNRIKDFDLSCVLWPIDSKLASSHACHEILEHSYLCNKCQKKILPGKRYRISRPTVSWQVRPLEYIYFYGWPRGDG